jgi:hypothetical protein
MVMLVAPQRPAELLLLGALAMPPTIAPSRSCSSASQGHARCGSSHTQSLLAARSTSAARTATPGGQGRSWGAGARRCGCSPRLGVILRCLWPLAATVVVRRRSPWLGGGASHVESGGGGAALPRTWGANRGASVPDRCKSLRTCCVCVLDMLQVSLANVSKLDLNFLMLQILIFDVVDAES